MPLLETETDQDLQDRLTQIAHELTLCRQRLTVLTEEALLIRGELARRQGTHDGLQPLQPGTAVAVCDRHPTTPLRYPPGGGLPWGWCPVCRAEGV